MNTDLSSEEIPGREAFGKGWRARLLLSCLRDSRPSYNWPRAILGKLLYNKRAVRQSHHHTQLTAQKRPDKRRRAHGTFGAVIGRRHTPSRNLFWKLCDRFSLGFSSFSLLGRGDTWILGWMEGMAIEWYFASKLIPPLPHQSLIWWARSLSQRALSLQSILWKIRWRVGCFLTASSKSRENWGLHVLPVNAGGWRWWGKNKMEWNLQNDSSAIHLS